MRQDLRQALGRHRAAERRVGDRDRRRRVGPEIFQVGEELPAVALARAALGHFAGQVAQAQLVGRLIGAAGGHEQGKGGRFEPGHFLRDEGQAGGELVGVDFLGHERRARQGRSRKAKRTGHVCH